MSVIEIIFSARFIVACCIYALLVICGLYLLEAMHHRLRHHLLMSTWEILVEPLYRAFTLVCFIFISYPVIFGIGDAPGINELLADRENRTHQLVNLVFISSLLLPMVPVIGKQVELVLPIQAILCCMMVFNWLARHLDVRDFSYWPGLKAALVILILSLITHWLSTRFAHHAGTRLDKKFNVRGFEQLTGESIILFMQAPAILVYSSGLGEQLIL